jgi:hypothetical protein
LGESEEVMTKVGEPKISEKVFQEQVRRAAIVAGFRIYHTWNSFRSTEGFPDNIMVHEKKKRLIVAELKSETGKVTDKQQEWLDAFRALPWVEVYLWRPADFDEAWEILKK